jgi:hypothetical protein
MDVWSGNYSLSEEEANLEKNGPQNTRPSSLTENLELTTENFLQKIIRRQKRKRP